MPNIEFIQKRDGRVLPFDREKITNAVFKAAKSVGGRDYETAKKLSDKVAADVKNTFREGQTPTVEQIQDIVEKVLIESGHARTAKAYILYRQERAQIRQEKKLVLEKEEIDEVDKVFDLNALRVLKARYLRKNEDGRLTETPKQLFTRIATHIVIPDILQDSSFFAKDGGQKVSAFEEFNPAEYDGKLTVGKYVLNQYHLDALKRVYDRLNKEGKMKLGWGSLLNKLQNGELDRFEKNIDEYFDLMVSRKFMPNTPAIANFGGPLGMGSACFVIDVFDSIESIMEGLKKTAIVFKSGGGMGYNFSRLRPEGDFVSTTSGVASGPLSFMSLFDKMTEVIKQGGIRRGANMGMLNSNHPDIEKFIKAKEGNKALKNFNISVLMMPDFWEHYRNGTPYPLANPRDGETVRTVDPQMLFDMIVYQAWESAEPGVIFFDTINEFNPFYEHLGPIITTNPCVAADSLISTANGLEQIDSIRAEEILVDNRTAETQVETNGQLMLTKQEGCELIRPKQIVKTGHKDCYKVETNSGYELVATADHKILTTNGWKELLTLEKGEEILIQSDKGQFSRDKKLPIKFENRIVGKNGRTYTLNLPNEWSKELGLLLGWLTGDGFISEKNNNIGLVFSPEDFEAQQAMQPIFEKYCNRKVNAVEYENGCVQLRSNSKFVVDFFLKLGVNPNERKVPKALFTAPEEAVLGFLEGLFSSDGTIALGSKSRNYIRLNSSSQKLLKQVQLLLLNLGIRSSIYNRSTKPKVFFYSNKNNETKVYETSGINYELNVSKQNLAKFLTKLSFLQSNNKLKAEKLRGFEFYSENFTDKVKSIEFVGQKEVWDITEPKTHSFIANGFVVHNCGEVLLYGNESCNLGSVNVWAFANEDENGNVTVDWEGMAKATQIAARFLDNVIDVNKYPLKDIEDMTLATRKTGVGIMGLAQLLYELKLPYNTEEGRKYMERVMEFVNYHSKVESIELAKHRGSLPYYDKSFYPQGKLPFKGAYAKEDWHFDWDKVSEDIKKYGVRNGFTTVVAPTGSISMIAGCSSGMEPVYSLVFEKNVKVGSFYYVDPVFERVLKEEGLYDNRLIEDMNANRGGLGNVPYVPEHLKRVFVTALDITPEDHIRALAAIQKWTDSSVSKTNNFPADATVEHMRKSYLLAYELGCKDVTVFRDTSIKDQVLVAAPTKKEAKHVDYAPQRLKAANETSSQAPATPQPHKKSHDIVAAATMTGSATVQKTGGKYSDLKNCPECSAMMAVKEGCISCSECGWGLCSIS